MDTHAKTMTRSARRLQLGLAAMAATALLVGCGSAGAPAPATDAQQVEVDIAGEPLGAVEIQALEIWPSDDGSRLEIVASETLNWTGYRNGEGDLVVELPNSVPGPDVDDLIPDEDLIRSVEVTAEQVDDRQLTRLLIRTAADAEHFIRSEGDRLVVALSATEPWGEDPEVAIDTLTPTEAVPVRPMVADIKTAGTADNPQMGPVPEDVPATRLEGVEVSTGSDSTVVWISGDGGFYYWTFLLEGPDRFVIDLIGVVNTSPVSSIIVQGALVDGVRVAQFKPQPDLVSRVVIDLLRRAIPEMQATPNGLRLTFYEEAATAEPMIAEVTDPLDSGEPAITEPPALEPVVEDEVAVEVMEAMAEPEPTMAEMEPESPLPTAVEDSVDSDPAPVYDVETAQPESAWTPPAVEPVELEEDLMHETPTYEPAAATEDYDAEPMAGEASLLEFATIDAAAGPIDSGDPESEFAAQDLTESDQPVYTGEPMTLTLRDADIKEVLRSFAQISGLNVVVQPEVQGVVTVEFTNVPWDQALDQILKINGLGYELEGNIMRVAPVEVLQREEQEKAQLAAAKALSIPLRTIIRRISYAKASEIAGILGSGGNSIMSARGSVVVDQRTNTLIIKELPSHINTVIAVIENLDIPEPQVMIEARIVETTKRFNRTLGVSWGFGGVADPRHGNTTGVQFPNRGTIDGGVSLLTGGANGFLDITLGNVLNTFNLDAVLAAAESDGLINIVSAPKITTLNNEEASIQSGLQIPIQTIANNTVSVQFVNATLELRVTPHVTAEGTVLMDIDIQKREPQLAFAVVGAANAPISTKEASTRVIVRDGGTTVIGGIYKVTSDQGEDRVPGLSNVPIIKHLFKNRRRNDENEELLIFITPRVIRL